MGRVRIDRQEDAAERDLGRNKAPWLLLAIRPEPALGEAPRAVGVGHGKLPNAALGNALLDPAHEALVLARGSEAVDFLEGRHRRHPWADASQADPSDGQVGSGAPSNAFVDELG